MSFGLPFHLITTTSLEISPSEQVLHLRSSIAKAKKPKQNLCYDLRSRWVFVFAANVSSTLFIAQVMNVSGIRKLTHYYSDQHMPQWNLSEASGIFPVGVAMRTRPVEPPKTLSSVRANAD